MRANALNSAWNFWDTTNVNVASEFQVGSVVIADAYELGVTDYTMSPLTLARGRRKIVEQSPTDLQRAYNDRA
jgi:hypothetical protein